MYSVNQYLTAAIQLKIAHILSNTDREINYAFFRLPLLVNGGAFCIFPVEKYSTYLPIQYACGCLIVILNFAYFFVGGFWRCCVFKCFNLILSRLSSIYLYRCVCFLSLPHSRSQHFRSLLFCVAIYRFGLVADRHSDLMHTGFCAEMR